MEPRVVLVGAGPSCPGEAPVHTWRLAHALHDRFPISVLLLHGPGRARARTAGAAIDYTGIARLGPVGSHGLSRALCRLARRRPDVLVLQWWPAATTSTHLAIGLWARAHGIKVVLDLHELPDPEPAGGAAARAAGPRLLRALVRLADAVVVRDPADLPAPRALGDLAGTPSAVIPRDRDGSPGHPRGDDPGRPATVLLIGGRRDHAGAADLIEAFSALPGETAGKLRLRVVGELGEGWDRPRRTARTSPHAALIQVENRRVRDHEIPALLAEADALAVPRARGTSGGPLSFAVSAGLPVLVHEVLREFVDGYPGAVLVPAGDVAALTRALATVAGEPGRRFDPPAGYGWSVAAARFEELFATLLSRVPR